MVEKNNSATSYLKPNHQTVKNLHLYPCNVKCSSVLLEAAPYTFSSKGKLNQLSAKVGYSYQCLTSTINFNLTGGNGSSVKVSMDQIEIQPYEVKNGKLGEGENKII